MLPLIFMQKEKLFVNNNNTFKMLNLLFNPLSTVEDAFVIEEEKRPKLSKEITKLLKSNNIPSLH